MYMIIGVDTGGTFTDFVFKDGGRWGVYKRPSTPENPAKALLEGLESIAHGKRKQVTHGSTVATNAILERKGAKTALVSNKGFEDLIEIGRQNRTRLYDLAYQREPHLIPPELRFGVGGRIACTGEELKILERDDLKPLGRDLAKAGVESVAICLLFAYLNPSHEQEIKTLLKSARIPSSMSHEILSEFREFERMSTTVVNAYVAPKMKSYMGDVMESLGEDDNLSIMQSNGGRISAETAMKESVRTILSGPAGGAVGAFGISRAAGYSKIIAFDMGGTSTDACLMDEDISLTTESQIAGYPIKIPMIDIHSVGAGGGSIAYLDEGGSLRVGPESAGAVPGPICYGTGRQVTVTDANLFLGRLIPEQFLGGHMTLQPQRVEPYLRRLALAAGITALDLAEGILDVVNTAMEKALRVISIERGYDPREFALVSYGGAGGMNAAFLARLLDIPRVLVLRNPGILSAMGMLMADIIKDYSLTVMKKQQDTHAGDLSETFAELEQRGIRELHCEGISEAAVQSERYVDMRYEGQSYELIVPFSDRFVEDFHQQHEKTYGYCDTQKGIEVVNIRLRARGTPEKPALEKIDVVGPDIPKDAVLGQREVVFEKRKMPSLVIDREKLQGGNVIEGPAIVTEYSSTTVIPPWVRASVDEYANLVLQIAL
jgi:N-methylhydantoinase A